MISNVENQTEERCGFLFGHESDENRTITKLISVHNTTSGDRRTSFAISSKAYLMAEYVAEQEGISLLGIYHSHPNCPATPSEYDRLAAQPYFSYVIISVIEKKLPAMRSWQLNSLNQFNEEQIELKHT